MTRAVLISGLMISTMTVFALAGPATAKNASQIRQEAIEKREAAQHEAIAEGRRDGGLTWLERYKLAREQRRIDTLEKKVLADGKITKDEYQQVKRAQDDAGNHIYSERHDQQVRGWWWRAFGG